MAATYTWDVFSSLDGFGSYDEPGDWGGYWGKQGPELIAHRLSLYDDPQRMVFGATTMRANLAMVGMGVADEDLPDASVAKMRATPATVISSTLEGPLDWPDATIATGDAVETITQLKAASTVPLRSHGSITLNRALLAAGLIDRIQVTIFPVLCGATGADPLFRGVDDFDLDLLDTRTLDSRTTELTFQLTRRTW